MSNQFTTDQFHLAIHGEFSADASSLGLTPGVAPYGRLFNDSLDVGIELHSRRTGQVAKFYLTQELKVAGELMLWTFAPTDEALRANPRLNGVCVTIFND